MTKEERQKAREKAQMEKAATADGKKRARDEGKPGKAKPRDGPAAKKCGLAHPLAVPVQAFPKAITMGSTAWWKRHCVQGQAWQVL